MDKKALFSLGFIAAFCFTQLTAQPPATYDLRDHDLVTSVKDQYSATCWAHATASGLESELLRNGNWAAAGETGEPNISECHLSWWMGFNTEWNGDFGGPNNDGLGVHNWGDFKMFCSYMSRFDGAVREEDSPGDGGSSQYFQQKPDRLDPDYHLWYVPDINWYYIDGDGPFGSLEYIDSIKYEVMNYGICPTNYLCNSPVQTGTYNGLNTYYLPNSSSADPNHNVGIIGWDDNANTPASQDGAWLCKNSWGNQIQFFWVSYYDKHCCRQIDESCVSFRDVQPLPYTNVYYLDYHGWRDHLESAKECFNKFIVDNTADEYLIDVSFFTMAVNEEWEIKVYDNFTNDELQDELASASGKIFAIGYHTTKLSTPVTLTDGDDFYIYLKVTNGGLAYDRTSSPFNPLGGKKVRADALIPSKSELDQSYYRTSPTSAWTDLYNYEETITVDGQSEDCQGSQNFCLKGFTIDTLPTGTEFIPTLPNTRLQLYNYPNPFSSQTTLQYNIPQFSSVSVEIFNARGSKIYSFADTRHNAGIIKTVWNGRDKYNNPLPSGVYYTVLTVKTGNSVMSEKRRMFLMK